MLIKLFNIDNVPLANRKRYKTIYTRITHVYPRKKLILSAAFISQYYPIPGPGIGINLSYPMKKLYGKKLQFVKTVGDILGKLDIIFHLSREQAKYLI
ncbi:MAG: hypothetical protein DWQ58_22210 [Microcystis aeruginosa TA09]|nr:MAG: hypothetical protein DWQ58_22210 [Microcystis aeruginosa TA09]